MKEKLKKIFICIIILFAALELASLIDIMQSQARYGYILKPYSGKIHTFETMYYNVLPYDTSQIPFGKIYGQEYKAAPILIFGDSAAYGENLKEQNTLSYILSEYTKKPVHNRAYGAWSVQNIYWQLTNQDFYKNIEEPEAVIIVYTSNMFYWMYSPNLSNCLKYSIKNGKIVRDSILYNIMIKSYFIMKIVNYIGEIKSSNFDKSFDDFKIYLVESIKEAKKHWKNTKFYILKIQNNNTTENKKRWKELEKYGYIILEETDITSKNNNNQENVDFDFFVDEHPTDDYWQPIVKGLVKKIKL